MSAFKSCLFAVALGFLSVTFAKPSLITWPMSASWPQRRAYEPVIMSKKRSDSIVNKVATGRPPINK